MYQNLFRGDFGLTPFQFQVKSMLALDSVNVKSASDVACSERAVSERVCGTGLNMCLKYACAALSLGVLMNVTNQHKISAEICKSFVCFVSLFVSVAIFVNDLRQMAKCK